MQAIVSNIFVSVWIWNITWGIYQAPLALFLLALLLKIIARFSVINALIVATILSATSWGIFGFFGGLFIHMLQISYVPMTSSLTTHTAIMSITLALLYTVLESILAWLLVPRYKRSPIAPILWSIVVSNSLSAGIMYYFAPLF